MSIGTIHVCMAQCYDCFHYSISRGMCDLKKKKCKAWTNACKQFKEW